MKLFLPFAAAILVLASCTPPAVTVSSPDGNLDFHLSVSEGQSVISIDYKGETVLLDSPVGKTSHVHSVSNELIATLSNSEGRYVNIYMRAFDDGVAYRYEIPEQENMKSLAVKAERMELTPAGDPMTKAMVLPVFTSTHEENYRTAPLSTYTDSLILEMPVFMSFPSGSYMAVTEANVVEYAGMMLTS